MKVWWGLLLIYVSILPGRADRIQFLDDHERAAQAQMEIIERAEHEIRTSVYSIETDGSAFAFLSLLREKARQGVRVQIVTDWVFNAILSRRPGMIRHLNEIEGFESRVFHPPSWDLGRWTQRMHDKILIVDGRYLYTGGRNRENPYLGYTGGRDRGNSLLRLLKRNRSYRDRDALVEGFAAIHASLYFDALWASDRVRPARIKNPGFPRRAERILDRFYEKAKRSQDPQFSLDLSPDIGDVRFVHDDVVGSDSFHQTYAEYLRLLKSAQESVVIESPYVIPDELLYDVLEGLISRGVRVEIITNSVNSTDNILAFSAYQNHRNELLKKGVRIYEYQGPDSLHSKTAVVDGKRAFVGSMNLDPRSFYLNTEVGVIFDNEEQAQVLLGKISKDRSESTLIGANDPRMEGASSVRKTLINCARALTWIDLIENQL